MNDLPARTDPEEAVIGRPAQTSRRLVEASVSPERPPRLRRRTPPARCLARRPAAPRHDPGPLPGPSCTTPAGPPPAPRWRSPRRASARSSPASPARPATARRGCRPATGGPPPIAGAGRRDRSGPRTWRPCWPPATGPRWQVRGVESEAVAAERGRVDAVIAGLLFMAGMRRSEVSALRWVGISEDVDRRFRRKWITDFGGSGSPIPVEVDRFRRKWITRFPGVLNARR